MKDINIEEEYICPYCNNKINEIEKKLIEEIEVLIQFGHTETALPMWLQYKQNKILEMILDEMRNK